MATILGLMYGSKWIHKTDDPDIVFVNFKTWITKINPKSAVQLFVDAKDVDTLSEAKNSLVLNVAERHLHLGQECSYQLEEWFWNRRNAIGSD